jgi:hypothetical protein
MVEISSAAMHPPILEWVTNAVTCDRSLVIFRFFASMCEKPSAMSSSDDDD